MLAYPSESLCKHKKRLLRRLAPLVCGRSLTKAGGNRDSGTAWQALLFVTFRCLRDGGTILVPETGTQKDSQIWNARSLWVDRISQC